MGLWQESDSPLLTAAYRSASPLHPGPWENPEKETKDEETFPLQLSAAKVHCPQCSSGFVREMTLAQRHFFMCLFNKIIIDGLIHLSHNQNRSQDGAALYYITGGRTIFYQFANTFTFR